jgi:hypothetical protein
MEPVILQGDARSASSGYGYGYGDGYGDGDGYGYGSGSGSGYGYGSGSGSGSYWLACLPYLTDDWTLAQRARLTALQAAGALIAYWCSDASGKPCNGGRGKAVSPGHVDTEKGPLALCERGTLHATQIPPKWQGERLWVVALTGDVIGDEEKFGALSREVIGEAIFK